MLNWKCSEAGPTERRQNAGTLKTRCAAALRLGADDGEMQGAFAFPGDMGQFSERQIVIDSFKDTALVPPSDPRLPHWPSLGGKGTISNFFASMMLADRQGHS